MKVEQLSFSAERAPISIEHEHSKITHNFVLYVHKGGGNGGTYCDKGRDREA